MVIVIFNWYQIVLRQYISSLIQFYTFPVTDSPSVCVVRWSKVIMSSTYNGRMGNWAAFSVLLNGFTASMKPINQSITQLSNKTFIGANCVGLKAIDEEVVWVWELVSGGYKANSAGGHVDEISALGIPSKSWPKRPHSVPLIRTMALLGIDWAKHVDRFVM